MRGFQGILVPPEFQLARSLSNPPRLDGDPLLEQVNDLPNTHHDLP